MEHSDICEDGKDEVETGFGDWRDDGVRSDNGYRELQQKQLNYHHIEQYHQLQQNIPLQLPQSNPQTPQPLQQSAPDSNKIILTYSINQHMINDKNFIVNETFSQMKQNQQHLQQQQGKGIQQQQQEVLGNQHVLEQGRSHQQRQMQHNDDIDQAIPTNQPTKVYITQPQIITRFHPQYKSPTITCDQTHTEAEQSKYYYQNYKLSLTQPITSINSSITFRVDNLKYCVGVGVGLKEILQKHQYDYKSTTSNELGHGLYVVTSQGYSWSHSQTQQDDVFRGDLWKNLYAGLNINVKLQGELLTFTCKKAQFTMTLPSRIRDKYTLCFCAYLHQKTDAISIVSQ